MTRAGSQRHKKNLSLTGVRTLLFSDEVGFRAATKVSLHSVLVILLGVTSCRFVRCVPSIISDYQLRHVSVRRQVLRSFSSNGCL
jgi:hypothetical protein